MLNRIEACVFVADGFEEIEAITTIDILRRGGVSVLIVSVTGSTTVTGAHGITIYADQLFESTDFSNASMLILPGGMPGASNLQLHDGLLELLRDFNAAQKQLAAICAAPKVFGYLGFLKNKNSICYPGFEAELIEAVLSAESVVTDQNITTAKGPGYSIQFGLRLLEILMGNEIANKVSLGMLVGQ